MNTNEGNKPTKKKSLNEAISDLAGLFEYGTIQADCDPAGFLTRVADEIRKLRCEQTT